MMKPYELKNIKNLYELSGEDSEWFVLPNETKSRILTDDNDVVAIVYGNAAHLAHHEERALFIANCRKSVPKLLEHIEKLSKELKAWHRYAEAASEGSPTSDRLFKEAIDTWKAH